MNTPRTYRKKPVVIQAMKYTYPASPELRAWMGSSAGPEIGHRNPNGPFELTIVTLEDGHDKRAKHVASSGDYIIKGVKGEFYACKPDVFEMTYEPVAE